MFTTLLLFHGLLAVALLGAVTHQAFAATAKRAQVSKTSFIARFRTTDAAAYSNAVTTLFAIVIGTGAILYPEYRMVVRPTLQALDLRAANGVFELKEHLSAIGLLLLPAYWASWRQPLAPDYAGVRVWLTWILAAMVWWNFIVGHLLVTIKGPFL